MAGEAEVAALEESRRAALAAGDIEALSDLIADDYIHVHATALIHDKAAMLGHVRKSPRTVAPRTPKIRVYGDFAILTGEMVNIAPGSGSAEPSKTRLYATQVARKIDGEWKFISFQTTRIPD
ncbi:MAG TPA: nuclear transport factor 2 family protein [Xanthobacteraceae bacterium]|nr:nuclear transport factor 2 family protein [Xanthobacteraceae bacterium]